LRIEEIIGQRIRERREEIGLSQSQLGRLLGEHLGRPWSRQTMSAVEAGDRNFVAAELVTLAHTLEVSVGHLLTPPPDAETVEIVPGIQAARDVLVHALVPAMTVEEPQREMQDTFYRLLRHVRLLTQAADDLHQDMDAMQRLAIAAVKEDT
jgi:transcriptional regulator with XRE-family HTH domain